MSCPALRSARAALALACLLGAPLVLAGAEVLARVGDHVIDSGSLRARAAVVGSARWAELGASWPERRRRLLELLIDEALLGLGAERPPAPRSARDAALASALLAALRADTGAASSAELEAAVARASAEQRLPRALELHRILVPSAADARALLGELASVSLAAFSQAARRASIDPSTSMRAGYLGWVAADGQTDVPELRVAPELFRAAEAVADGELVREPVREGDAFAVIWRRASRPAREPASAELLASAAARLAAERLAAAQRALLDSLRREHLSEHHPERLAGFEPAFPEAARPPPPPAPVSRSPWLTPLPTDRGLR